MARPVLRTPLSERLGIEYPIILAGMGAGQEGGAAGPELVAAVSEAGGLGVLGGTGHNLDTFHAACAEIRRLTKRPFGVDLLMPSVGSARAFEPKAVIDQKYWDWVDATLTELGLPTNSALPMRNGGPFTDDPAAAAQ